MDGIILEHVDHVLKIDEGVVDGDDIELREGESVTEDDASDATETVRSR
jgi:hypothetical protein